MSRFDEQVVVVTNQGWDPRLVVCRNGSLVDTCMVVSDRFVVLIDSLWNRTTARQLLDLARPYMKERQLLVVNTHADWDHAWGNHVFSGPAADYPAPIIASRKCAERLRSAEDQHTLNKMQQQHPGQFDDVHLTPPTLYFDDTLLIDGGDLSLQLFPTPGHTSDHIAVFIPEIETLWAGDAAELPFPLVHTPDSVPVIRHSLAKMTALQPQYALYCHAAETSGPAVLQHNSAYFDLLEHHCRAALARGLSLQQINQDPLEQVVGLPYEDVVPAGLPAAELASFYQPAHQTALRCMLTWLQHSNS